MKQTYDHLTRALGKIRFLPPLFFRLLLAAVFFTTFLHKIDNVPATASYFAQIGFPFPVFSVYLSIIIEGIGVLFLFLGFATRLISFVLILFLIVAIATVHWANGFSAVQGGYEIPLYYILMLFSLFVSGAGSISIDALMRGQRTAN